MTRRFRPPSPEVVARIHELAQRRVSPSEFDAYVNAPMSDEERQEIHSLIDWFTRRYKTPAERLAYTRRVHARWQASMPRVPAGRVSLPGQRARPRISSSQKARHDLGDHRSKPAWIERDHALPFFSLSADEFEVFCYLLLLYEDASGPGDHCKELYYYGRSGDLGRDIVRELDGGDTELIQCKRYQQKLGTGEVRDELAKLYVNVYRGVIPRPTRIAFYVASDLTAPAKDLLRDYRTWQACAQQALSDFLKTPPEPAILEFARNWCPAMLWQSGLDLTVRARKFPELVDEFFAFRKVITGDAAQLGAEIQALDRKADQNSAKLDEIRELLRHRTLPMSAEQAPGMMRTLIEDIERKHPGVRVAAETTVQGTIYKIRAKDTPVPVGVLRFPDSEAGRRGWRTFLRAQEEGREVTLAPDEYEWENFIAINAATADMTPAELVLRPQAPGYRKQVRLVCRDTEDREVASVHLAELEIVRAGTREAEVVFSRGALAGELRCVVSASERAAAQLTFTLDLASQPARLAKHIIALLLALHDDSALWCMDVATGDPLIEIAGFQASSFERSSLENSKQLLECLAQINREFGTDIRYPAELPDETSVRTARLLAGGIEHGQVAVRLAPQETWPIGMSKKLALQLIDEWRTGRDLDLNTGPQQSMVYTLWGHSLDVGTVTRIYEKASPPDNLDALAEYVQALDDHESVVVSVHCYRVLHEFARWLRVSD